MEQEQIGRPRIFYAVICKRGEDKRPMRNDRFKARSANLRGTDYGLKFYFR